MSVLPKHLFVGLPNEPRFEQKKTHRIAGMTRFGRTPKAAAPYLMEFHYEIYKKTIKNVPISSRMAL